MIRYIVDRIYETAKSLSNNNDDQVMFLFIYNHIFIETLRLWVFVLSKLYKNVYIL